MVKNKEKNIINAFIQDPSLDIIRLAKGFPYDEACADYYWKAMKIMPQGSWQYNRFSEAVIVSERLNSRQANSFVTYPFVLKACASLLREIDYWPVDFLKTKDGGIDLSYLAL